MRIRGDLNRLWQDQPTEEVRMAIEDIRNRARKMERERLAGAICGSTRAL